MIAEEQGLDHMFVAPPTGAARSPLGTRPGRSARGRPPNVRDIWGLARMSFGSLRRGSGFWGGVRLLPRRDHGRCHDSAGTAAPEWLREISSEAPSRILEPIAIVATIRICRRISPASSSSHSPFCLPSCAQFARTWLDRAEALLKQKYGVPFSGYHTDPQARANTWSAGRSG
jgi:hypothetical protein